MPVIQIKGCPVERVWGRRHLPAQFAVEAPERPVGEIWFADPSDSEKELLVKYIFTSERLSIQVHPDDDAARKVGQPRGKDEAWMVLDAEPGAVIGLGLKREVSRAALKAAALDGSIETLVDWRSVAAGDLIYSPAGTVHAIGAGLALIEIQQNLDLTYRLYDYRRPRELHVDEAVGVADRGPWVAPSAWRQQWPGREILAAGRAFVVERWTFTGRADLHSRDDQLQLIPVRTGGTLDGEALTQGSVWHVAGQARIDAGDGMDLLATYPDGAVRTEICVAI